MADPTPPVIDDPTPAPLLAEAMRNRRVKPLRMFFKVFVFVILWLPFGVLSNIYVPRPHHDFAFFIWATLLITGSAVVVWFHYRGVRTDEEKARDAAAARGIPLDPSQASSDELFCADCGYDLRAITSDRCPECGWTIDRDILARSHLPWAHRRQIGRWRAYWRTVWTGSWRIKKLATEIVRPVDPRDARRFATVTALIATIPLALTVLAVILNEGGTGFLNPSDTLPGSTPLPAIGAIELLFPFAAGITLRPMLPLAIVICGWLLTRAIPTHFLASSNAPPLRRQRAEALSYYLNAPMVFINLAAGFWLLALTLAHAGIIQEDAAGMYTQVGAGVGIIYLCFLLIWINTLRLLRRTLHASALRLLVAAAALPITWIICAAVALYIFPWVVGFIWLVIDSLRP